MFARRVVLFARLCTPGLTLAKASCSPLSFCELKSSVVFSRRLLYDAAPSLPVRSWVSECTYNIEVVR